MKSHYITGGSGTKLYVEEFGNPQGIPLLFIHGISQSRLSWLKQIHSYLAEEFRLVAMDIRGHGFSEKPRFGYDQSKNWADDVQAVICSLDLKYPVLIGWSYGGLIVSDYLLLYGDDSISGMMLVDTSASIGTKEAEKFWGPERKALSHGLLSDDAETSSTALQNFVSLLFCTPPAIEDYYFILGYNSIVPPYVRQGMNARSLSNDHVLSQVRVPVLICHGAQDKVLRLQSAMHIADVIQHARLSIYENAGHSPFWENSLRFNAELHRFAKHLG